MRQYRPAVEERTLELPSGHVDPGETPIAAATRELMEETGYVADKIEEIGVIRPDTGRLSNRLWCFFATVRPSADVWHKEADLEVLAVPCPAILRSIRETDAYSRALSCGDRTSRHAATPPRKGA